MEFKAARQEAKFGMRLSSGRAKKLGKGGVKQFLERGNSRKGGLNREWDLTPLETME